MRQASDNGEPSDCVTAALLTRIDEQNGKPRAELVAAVKQMAVTAYVGTSVIEFDCCRREQVLSGRY